MFIERKTIEMSVTKVPSGRYRAAYRDPATRKQYSKTFDRKSEAKSWHDAQVTALATGTHIDPKTAKMTVEQWCATWLDGYGTRRPSTVRQAKVHINHIVRAFGSMRLADVRPSQVKGWTASMKADGLADSTVYATYRRFAQIMADAAHDGLVPRSPCSRRTSPGQAEQRPYCATTEQMWALHDAFPVHLRPAILLGAFAGLRTAEVAALRVSDVDFMRGVVKPAIQFPAEPLKSKTAQTPIPIPGELALILSAAVARWGGETIVTDGHGSGSSPWAIERAMRKARGQVAGLPEGFRFHDLRHYFASLLIAKGHDIKMVQKRMRHASAKTTLDTYGHLWPDTDESTRSAVGSVLAERADSMPESAKRG